MRIGFEAKRATHNFRGLGNYSRGLIEGLLLYSTQDELFLYSPPIKDIRAQAWIDSLSANAHLKIPDTFIEKKLSGLWRSFLLSKDLLDDKLDIFHGLSHEIPFGLKGNKPYKKIVTIHDLIFLRYPHFFPAIDRMVYLQKFTYACKNSDMVIAICQQTKDDLIQLLGVPEKKIFVHYQSCAPHFYQPLPSSQILELREKYKLQRPYILNVGAFEKNKNQLTLLQAFAEIASTIEEDLVFIGQGKKYKEEVVAKIAELNLENRVHLFSSIPFSELPTFYQGAKLFCFPSLFEGFGIPITEALFSNVPVITSQGFCFPESAGPGSYYIDPLSHSSIAQGLAKVLGDQTLQNSMIQQGQQFVQRFHRRETTAKLKELYTQVLY